MGYTLLSVMMLLSAQGCSDDPDAVEWSVDSPQVETGQASVITLDGKVPYLGSWIDGSYASLLMDTGSSLTFINAARYGHDDMEAAWPDTLRILNATWYGPYVLYEDMGTDAGVPDGIVGMDRLLSVPWQVDYPRRTAVFMDPDTFTPPRGAAMDMELAGGGYFSVGGELYHIVPNRLLVHTLIEGVPATCILDTGASYVAVRQSFLDTLPDTRRQSRGTVTVYTAHGFETVDLFGLGWISLEDGSERVDSPTGFTLSDDSFANMDDEVGSAVDCFLGGSYLEHFTLTFDGPGGRWYLTDGDD